MPAERSLLALLVAALVVGSPTASLAIPGPVTVESGTADGTVAIAPVGQVVSAAPGERVRVDLRLTNGGDATVAFSLAVRSVTVGDDGQPVPTDADDEHLPSARAWIGLPAEAVSLAPGETAHLPLAVTTPTDAAPRGYVAAVTAASTDLDPVVEVTSVLLVRLGPGEPPNADLTVLSDGGGAAAELVIASDVGTVIDEARIEVRSWASTTPLELDVGPIVVLPGAPRTIRAPFPLPRLPGGYRADASFRIADETTHVTTTVWLWHRGLLLGLAALLLLATAATVAIAHRRRGRGPYAPDTDHLTDDGGDAR